MTTISLAKQLGQGIKVSSKNKLMHSGNKVHFDRAFSLIESICKKAGAEIEMLEHAPYRTLIVKKGKPKGVFIGHIDVVSAKEDEFEPKEKDGKLFFRGACDMLGPVAAIVSAFEKGVDDVWLVLSDNEEIGRTDGGILGFRKKYDFDMKVNTKFVFDPDGGNGNIILGQKGCYWIELIANGKKAHGSQPGKGKNAIELVYEQVKNLKSALENGFALYPERAITINLGTIHGGTAVNVVPEEARAELDIRFWENDLHKVYGQIKALGENCRIKNITEPWETKKIHPQIVQLALLMEELDMPVGYELALGSSDLSLFSIRSLQINQGIVDTQVFPQLMLRPLSGNQHADEEWVDIQSLIKFEQLMFKLMNFEHLKENGGKKHD